MNMRKKLLNWCRNPTKPVPTSLTRLSKPKPIIASILLAEIIALLLVPMAYYALLAPKSSGSYSLMQSFPLTNSQIKAAWPNLPTAQQIMANAKAGHGSAMIIPLNAYNVSSNSTATCIILTQKSNGVEDTFKIENCTVMNEPDFKNGGVIPIAYEIWLPYNGTGWVEVSGNYLATSHPPSIPSQQQGGFLGTHLPTEYGIIAVTTTAVTAAASAGYVFLRRKRTPSLVSN